MKIGVISDIDGNVAALDAVLADAATRQFNQIVNLGDICSGGLFPRETAERLMSLKLPTICGNHERQLTDQPRECMGLSDRHAGVGTFNRRWLHADERGSIIASTDAAGQLLASANCDEFGNPGGSSVGRFGYTGQMALPEIGLYYYKARMYSPSLGRFMQTDPIGYGDGLNLYDYVGGGPINNVDPFGLTCYMIGFGGPPTMT